MKTKEETSSPRTDNSVALILAAIIPVLLFVGVTGAWGGDAPNALSVSSGIQFNVTQEGPKMELLASGGIVIYSQDKNANSTGGRIEISPSKEHAKFFNISPDSGAVAFWDAVAAAGKLGRSFDGTDRQIAALKSSIAAKDTEIAELKKLAKAWEDNFRSIDQAYAKESVELYWEKEQIAEKLAAKLPLSGPSPRELEHAALLKEIAELKAKLAECEKHSVILLPNVFPVGGTGVPNGMTLSPFPTPFMSTLEMPTKESALLPMHALGPTP